MCCAKIWLASQCVLGTASSPVWPAFTQNPVRAVREGDRCTLGQSWVGAQEKGSFPFLALPASVRGASPKYTARVGSPTEEAPQLTLPLSVLSCCH